MSDETRPAAETLEQFRIISELVADYAFSCGVTLDGALPIEWATDSLARVTGYTKDEINRRGWQALIHPDDLPTGQRELDRLRAGQTSVSELRIIRKDGDVRWVRSYSRPVLDARGYLVRIHGAAQDITTITDHEGAARLLTGLAFDPASTAGNLILWTTHSMGGVSGLRRWCGRARRRADGAIYKVVVSLSSTRRPICRPWARPTSLSSAAPCAASTSPRAPGPDKRSRGAITQ